MMGFGLGMMWGGFSLIFLIIIIIAVIYFINNKNDDNSSSYHSNNNDFHYQVDRAEEIAKERYAKGEISKEEFDQIIKDLK